MQSCNVMADYDMRGKTMAVQAVADDGFDFYRIGIYGEIETCRTPGRSYRTYAEAVAASAPLRAKTIAEYEAHIAALKAIDAPFPTDT